MQYILLVLLCVFGFRASAAAQGKSVAELANYRGADREEILQAGAREEGKLTWYTTLTAHRDIANVFEAKYPGIKVETYRTGSTDLLRRILSEARSMSSWRRARCRCRSRFFATTSWQPGRREHQRNGSLWIWL